jgi:hypothetical protein
MLPHGAACSQLPGEPAGRPSHRVGLAIAWCMLHTVVVCVAPLRAARQVVCTMCAAFVCQFVARRSLQANPPFDDVFILRMLAHIEALFARATGALCFVVIIPYPAHDPPTSAHDRPASAPGTSRTSARGRQSRAARCARTTFSSRRLRTGNVQDATCSRCNMRRATCNRRRATCNRQQNRARVSPPRQRSQLRRGIPTRHDPPVTCGISSISSACCSIVVCVCVCVHTHCG